MTAISIIKKNTHNIILDWHYVYQILNRHTSNSGESSLTKFITYSKSTIATKFSPTIMLRNNYAPDPLQPTPITLFLTTFWFGINWYLRQIWEKWADRNLGTGCDSLVFLSTIPSVVFPEIAPLVYPAYPEFLLGGCAAHVHPNILLWKN